MDSLREPTPDLDGFQLPAFDAPRDAWEEAFAQMRKIELTWPQLMAGYQQSWANNQGYPDIILLRAWCEQEGLLPFDVTAETILVRMSPVEEELLENPHFDVESQESMALRDLRVERDVLQFVGGEPWFDADLG